MANKNPKTDQLIYGDRLSHDEATKNGSKGGKASVEARKKRKALKELMETALQMEEKNESYRSLMKKAGWKDMDQMSVITQGLIQRAKTGDVQAYNAIRDIIGEKPTDKMEVSGDLLSHLRVVRESREDDPYVPRSEDEIPD